MEDLPGQCDRLGRRDPDRGDPCLGRGLVERPMARAGYRPDIRDPDQGKDLPDGAVLPVTTVNSSVDTRLFQCVADPAS